MSKLKNCPFCDSEAILCTRQVNKPKRLKLYEIGCNKVMCPCWIAPQDFELEGCCEPELSGYALKKEAIKYWNIRAESKILKMVIEELKAIRKVK